jgi:hypothetical protein
MRALLLLLAFATAHAEGLRFDLTEVAVTPRAGAQEVLAHFPFTNAGTAPVTITETIASCGCTSVHHDLDTYAAGAKGELLVTFEVGGRSGLQRKSIQVYTNGGPMQLLELVVHLGEAPTVTPGILYWTRGEPATPREALIAIPTGADEYPLSAIPSRPRMQATLSPKAGGAWAVTVTPQDTAEITNVLIEIKTNLGHVLYVFANIADPGPAR